MHWYLAYGRKGETSRRRARKGRKKEGKKEVKGRGCLEMEKKWVCVLRVVCVVCPCDCAGKGKGGEKKDANAEDEDDEMALIEAATELRVGITVPSLSRHSPVMVQPLSWCNHCAVTVQSPHCPCCRRCTLRSYAQPG